MDTKDKYGFQTTSRTMVEKLAHGEEEAWKRFCERYYEPIKHVFNAINRKYRCPIDSVEVGNEIHAIIEELKVTLQTYDPERGKLRKWLSTVVRNAIIDYAKKKAPVPLPEDYGTGKPSTEGQQTSDDEEWIQFLQFAAIKFAEVGRPWSARDKKIIKVIKEELKKAKKYRLSDKEIASAFKITEANLRKIRSRYMAEVRKQYDEFKQDDPEFFKDMKKYSISFDALLDEYLKEFGGEEELAKQREDFKKRHVL